MIAGNHDLTLDESMESNQSRRYRATNDEEGQGTWVSQAKELKEEIGKRKKIHQKTVLFPWIFFPL